jgi:nucleotide-binding universal stress UspA family protein
MLNRQLVLVAVDRVTDVQRTMGVALSTAKARGADLHVIHIVPHRVVPVDDRSVLWPFEFRDDRRGSTEVRRSSLPRSAVQDEVRVRRVVLRGEPERVIPAYAQLHEATILVVERDYGSARFWRSTRVVDAMARRSPIPLLVLPKRRTPERERSVLPRILAPIDFSIASAVTLRTAFDLSHLHGARVTLVHALKDVPRHMVFSGSEAWVVVRRLPAQLDAVADRLRRRAALFGLTDVEIEATTGDSDRAILEIASRADADLIVMGIAHRSWLDRVVFGSTLRRVLRRATTPVLVIPVVAGAHVWLNDHDLDQFNSSEWAESAADRVAA